MKTIHRTIVSALIFSKDGKLFMGMKDAKGGGVYSDCWHIPGGGIDDGEDHKQALIREIKEETGIDVSGYEITLIDNTGRGVSTRKLKDTDENARCEMDFFVYEVVVSDKDASEITVSLDDDIVKYEWVDTHDLDSYKLTPPSERLFNKLGLLKSPRPYTTLFLLESLDGKISTGGNDNRDVDKDLKRISGVKEGLHQYYDIEQQTDPFSLNSGRVMQKIGVNERTDEPKKIPVSFVIIDNKPHLTEQGVKYLSKWVKKLFLVTHNKNHPAYALNSELENLEIIEFEHLTDATQLLKILKEEHNVERLTIQTGSTFNATWLRDGLIDEVSIVIAPMLVGGNKTASLVGGDSFSTFEELKDIKVLEMSECKQLDHSYLHLKYKVKHPTEFV